MTHFTQNTLATTTQTLTSKRIDSINQGTYLTPSTHTTREHHTTIKTGRTQIRFNNLPTQTPGGHHTQITPHPKRPSETHTPHPKQKNTPPTSPTPTSTTTTHPHKQHHQTTIPTPYTHAHKRSPPPHRYPATQHTQALPATQRLHSLRPTRSPTSPTSPSPTPRYHTLTLRVSFADAHSTHPVLDSAFLGYHTTLHP